MLRDFSKERFDIILQAGQSNSDGTGFGPASAPYAPKEEVWYLRADGGISPACERVDGNQIAGNFALSFADRYIQRGRLLPGRKILVVRAAVGGTGFSDHRWGTGEDLYENMLSLTAAALSLNPDNRLVCLLWHQGETDAANRMDYQTYKKNLVTLVKGVRETFCCEGLPFVAGDFVPQWKESGPDDCGPVLSATRDICDEDSRAAFVLTDGLESNCQRLGTDDIIHFCREALYQLGERYFQAYDEILGR